MYFINLSLFLEINIEIRFAETFDEYRNAVENAFLMVKMNIGDSLNMNLYDYVSLKTFIIPAFLVKIILLFLINIGLSTQIQIYILLNRI